MQIAPLDWTIIIGFFIVALAIGTWASKRAGRSTSEYFLSGRHMPWYLLGMSMVATTFSVDTPNLVTDIVRQNGVAGNWVWWAFLLTGMLTVFIYARLWRRSAVMTDVEFYELRYSGRPAAFLRGFRALYLGIFFNVVIMASVTLAIIKFSAILLDFTPLQTILVAGGVTVVYSSLGGFLGVLLTDFIMFAVAMVGSVCAAYFAVNHAKVGGLAKLLSHPQVADKLAFLPDFSNTEMVVTLLVIPLAVQWWSVWYPGAEPGGGGYVAQRMLAARNENHAVASAFFFNVAHYALRPWPWILVALSSIVIYPELASLKQSFPTVNENILGHDLAYPAMIQFIPTGFLGLTLASIVAAYMSTISTSLNWGASYIVNDFYKRFVNPGATEKRLVLIGRIATVLMMVLASSIALFLESSLQAFNVLLQIGAGTGLLFILRWFWWRINAYSELTAMLVSFVLAGVFMIYKSMNTARIEELVQRGVAQAEAVQQVGGLKTWEELVLGVGITTLAWLLVTFLTKPADQETLRAFCALVHPGGPGWTRVLAEAKRSGNPVQERAGTSNITLGLLAMLVACGAVYCALFGIGSWIYGNILQAAVLTSAAILFALALKQIWGRLADPTS